MTEKGFRVVFERNTGTVYLGQQVVARAQQDGSFKLMTMEEETRVASTKECIHRWHRRLGHKDLNAIKCLAKV